MNRFSEGLIKPDLILLLRRILDGYPDNGQILKELIQNAEDAGATEVKFLLDEGSYPSQNLYKPEMEKFQGPALYAFNNSEFTDIDWKGICLLHDSVKINDSEKIGRFGLGFKSVFHMTDFPGLLSGHGIAFIDPYERYFSNPKTGDPSSCKLWDLENSEDRVEMQAKWDQFQPFCQHMFHSGDLRLQLEDGYRNKTLFRFPLRRQQNDGSNRLSNRAYTTEAVKDLFRSLEVEAKEILLFLSKLQKVEAYVKSSDGSQTLFFSIFKNKEKILIPRGLSDQKTTIRLNLVKTETRYSSNFEERITTDFLALFYDDTNLQDIDIISTRLGVTRKVGLALNLSDIKNLSTGDISAEIWSKYGQLFCFLPLPKRMGCETGFAFHIHGCFVVDSSRSQIKMPPNVYNENLGEDLKWNGYLIHRAIPNAMVAFCKVISSLEIGFVIPQILTNISDKLNIVYTIMPHPDCVDKVWESTMKEFYNLVFHHSYNMWLLTHGNVSHIGDDTYFALWLKENNPDQIIHEVIKMAGKKIINVSENVLIALREHSESLKAKEISPDSFSSILKHIDKPTFSQLSNDARFAVLSYLFSNDLTRNITSVLDRIKGLELVPLENGTWTMFQSRSVNSSWIFISSNDHSIKLLPGLGQHFLKENISSELMSAMKLITDTERTQLTYLNQASFMDLLQHVRGLEPSNTELISYKVAPFNNDYLSNLWNYFRRTIDLRMLESRCFHIIPMNSSLTKMVLFSSKLPLLIGNESVDRKVVCCCQEMGIIVLEYFPGYIQVCEGIVGNYAFAFNVNGIFECIRRIGVKKVISKLNTVNTDLRIAFRIFLGVLLSFESISSEKIKVLRQLPLFKIVNEIGSVPTQLVSAEGANSIGALDFPSSIKLLTPIIQAFDEGTRQIATRTGINLYTAPDILKYIVLPQLGKSGGYSPKEVEQIMITIYQDYRNLFDDQNILNQHIYNLPFIPTSPGKWMHACDLFDSNDPTLATLFVDGDKFPTGILASDEYRPLLKRLGLKSLKSMNADDIISAAELVRRNPSVEKCATMMRFVESVGSSIFNNDQRNQKPKENQKKTLQTYSWILPDSAPPDRYPVGLGFRNGYSAPPQVCSRKFWEIIGSVRPTIDTTIWPNLSKLFGWCNDPNTEYIISHFINVINYCDNIDDSNIDRRRMISSVQHITESIYHELNRRAKQQRLTPGNCTKLLEIACIFVEGKFVSPKICAKDYHRGQQCLPWFCGLPQTMKDFKDLIKFLGTGIKEKFETADFLKALRDMHDIKSTTPLNDIELRIAISIVEDLATSIKSNEKRQFSGINVYVPDVNRILREANTLWLYTSATLNSEVELDDNRECHRDISLENGALLGINTKEKILLKPFTIPFGPTEKQTRRIKKVLQTTSFGMETLKEFIKNADYAGATEVQIILDTRKLPCNEGWKISHGPALVIYNNKPFTTEDLQEIQCLDKGNKKDDATRTEQCALGFNAAYHLTDVPSLLTTVDTERILCVFDPTHTFICQTNEGSGNQYSNIEKLKLHFPDSFLGYLEEEFSKTEGSLFRLPLRVGPSDLGDSAPGIKSIESSLLNLQDELSLQLLFVNNITHISVKKINQTSNRLETLYCLKSEKLDFDNEPFAEFDVFLYFYKNSSMLDIDGSGKLLSHEVSYKLTIKNNGNLVNDYIVVQRCGLKDRKIPKDIIGLHRAGKLRALPLGGVAFRLPTELSMIQNPVNHTKLFCSLSIQDELNLPVYVNGSWYFDNNNRRSSLRAAIEKESQTGHRVSSVTWNTYLIENVISEAYRTLLDVAKGLVDKNGISLNTYMKLFPEVSETFPESVIVKALYENISSSQLLPVQKISSDDPVTWCDPKSGYFDTISDQKDGNVLRSILSKSGLSLFDSSSILLENFRKSDIEVKKASPENVLSFYKTKTEEVFEFCTDQENDSELEAVSCVLRYCKASKNFKKRLIDTPLLVSQDGLVTRFDQNNKLFVTKYPNIIPHEQGRVVHTEIASILSLDSLNEENKLLCNHLTVSDFAKFLPSLFGRNHSLNDNRSTLVRLDSLSEQLKPYLEHLYDNNCHYVWLEMVWKFLEDEICRTGDIKDEHHTQKCLNVLNRWYLLPVYVIEKGSAVEYLMPLSKSQRIMSKEYIQMHLSSLHDILLKIRMPLLLSTSENQTKYDTKLIRLHSGMETCTTADLLIDALSGLDLENINVSLEEQTVILNYFNEHVKEFESSEIAKSTLQRFPFYETINERMISLPPGYTFFVLPRESNINLIDLQNCTREAEKVIVLTNDGSCEHLLEFLGCKILSESELYLKFILDALPSMEYEDSLRYLKYIRDNLFDTDLRFKSHLSELEFIKDHRQEGRKKAGFYYDPRVKLFANMKEFCTFPPIPFYQESNNDDYEPWLDFLKECGLASQVEESHILQFASHLEEKSEDCIQSDPDVSSHFLLHYIANNAESISKECWNKLKQVKFIEGHQQRNCKNSGSTICLMGSYLYKDHNLVCTLGNILPSSLHSVCSKNQLQKLCNLAGIKENATEDDVVQNLVTVAQENVGKPQDFEFAKELRQICWESFEFLDQIGNLSQSSIDKLMEAPCIAIDTEDGFELVQSNNVVFNVYRHRRFHPYLYILPEKYRTFSSIMNCLGIKEDASVVNYIKILAEINRECSGILSSPALQMVNDALGGLFRLLDQNNTTEDFTENLTLYLPGYIAGQDPSKLLLYKSTEIIFNDNKIDMKRLNKNYGRPLFCWNFSKSDNLSPEILEKKIKLIPAKCRPKVLSEVVHEQFVSYQKNHKSLGMLETKFRSKQFRHAILCLAKQSYSLSSEEGELRSLEKVLKGLETFSVLVCETVETELFDIFDNDNQETTNNGNKIVNSEANVSYFIKDATVYLSKNGSHRLSKDILHSKLAQVLNRVTMNSLSNVMHKIPAILNCDPELMGKCLNDLDVPEFETESDEQKSPEPSNESQYPHHSDLNAALVWMKQAEHDLKSAEKDLSGDVKYYEWSCYKCYTAAEKAIKAILLVLNGMYPDSHDLMELIRNIPNPKGENQTLVDNLTDLVQTLNKVTDRCASIHYPSTYSVNAPHDKLDEETANNAKFYSKAIVAVARKPLATLLDSKKENR